MLAETLQSIKFMDVATVQETIELPPNMEYNYVDDELRLPKENTKLKTQIGKIICISYKRIWAISKLKKAGVPELT